MRIALAGVLMGLAGTAASQTAGMVDPTRPPQSGAERPGATVVQAAGPRLQSVLISPARRVAVISGSSIALGGRYGEATVASISEDAVILRYRGGRQQTLYLVPPSAKTVRAAGEAGPEAGGDSR